MKKLLKRLFVLSQWIPVSGMISVVILSERFDPECAAIKKTWGINAIVHATGILIILYLLKMLIY